MVLRPDDETHMNYVPSRIKGTQESAQTHPERRYASSLCAGRPADLLGHEGIARSVKLLLFPPLSKPWSRKREFLTHPRFGAFSPISGFKRREPPEAVGMRRRSLQASAASSRTSTPQKAGLPKKKSSPSSQ